MKRRRKHPQVIDWMWFMSKDLGGYLQIYDIGQQKTWLHWLLLKEFGHHLANTLPKNRRMKERWRDTCIIEQLRVWMHGVDMILISFIVSSSHDWYNGGMGRQHNVLLLGLFLGEQGQICSHTLYDVAGGGDGIISLVFDDDWEALPSWEVFHICCSIIRGVFDKEHVKEWSYELAEDHL